MLNIYSFVPVICYSMCRKETEKLDITLDSMVIYPSHAVADQVLHGQSVDELYIYENEHKDIKFILNSVQKYKMENEPINPNEPNWL